MSSSMTKPQETLPTAMSGLIERLRARTPSRPSYLYGDEGSELINPDGPEAADTIEALQGALEWAIPLAKTSVESHRVMRLKCGHHDIRGTDAKGNAVLGLYQSEVDALERAAAILNREKTNVR